MSQEAIADSMFAIFTMFINLGTVGGQVFGGWLTENFGFEVMVLALSMLNLASIILLNRIFF